MSAKTLPLTGALGDYLVAHTMRETAEQRALRRATQRMPDANMQTAPEQGALLQVLVRLCGAPRRSTPCSRAARPGASISPPIGDGLTLAVKR